MEKLPLRDFKLHLKEQGFTLIEILVALTIMSFMLIGIYNIVDGTTTVTNEILDEDGQFLEIYTALGRIERDLSQYYTPRFHSALPKANEDDGQNPSYAQERKQNIMPINEFFMQNTVRAHPIPLFSRAAKNDITFMTSGHRRYIEGQQQSRYAWIHYFLDKAKEGDPPETSRLFRQIISEDIYTPELDFSKVRQTLLLKGVKSLIFLYWNKDKEEWSEQYDFERDSPPMAFKVEIEWVDSRETKMTFEKSIRSYWYPFDVDADEASRVAKPNNSNNGTQVSPNGSGGTGQ